MRCVVCAPVVWVVVEDFFQNHQKVPCFGYRMLSLDGSAWACDVVALLVAKTGRVVRDPRPLSPRPSHLHQRTRFIPPHLSPFSCACVPSLSFTHIRNVPTFVCRTSRTAAVGQPARPQRATAAVGPHTARIAAGGGRGRVSCGNGGLQQPISAATTATAAAASTAAANGAAKADTNSLGRRPGRRG